LPEDDVIPHRDREQRPSTCRNPSPAHVTSLKETRQDT
jgi:hypothetical protein